MQLPSTWQVPQELRESVADRVGRQRVLTSADHLLLVLHKVPKPGKPERVGLLLWRNSKGEWFSSETGEGLQVLRKHIEAYASAVDAQEADFEHAGSSDAYHEILQSISPVHRASSHMHSVLQAARELCRQDAKLGSMADWSYEISRAADLLHTDAKNAMDYELARQTAMQAEASRKLALVANRLNVIAALFLPLMAFASLFGMNLHSGLDDRDPGIFWGILFAGLLLGIAVWVVALRAGSPPRERRRGGKSHWVGGRPPRT